MPRYKPTAAAGAPRISAPPVAATPIRFSVEYLVSGIWNARSPAVQISTMRRPAEFAVQSSPVASAANRTMVPSTARVAPYDWRILFELNRIDGGSEIADEMDRRVDAGVGGAHERAADDDAIGQAGDGGGLVRLRDAEADAHREIGDGAEGRNRLGELRGDVAALAGDAEPADEVDEAAAVPGDLGHALAWCRRRDESDVVERAGGEARFERRVGAQRQVGDEETVRARLRRARQGIGTGGENRIQVAEQND